MRTGNALLGVLAGIAVGAAIGAILARGGKQGTRKDITKKGEDFANALNDKIDEKFEELMNSITGKVKKSRPQNGETASKSELVG